MLGESAGLLRGSRTCCSVIRASTAKVRGLGFDSQLVATKVFFFLSVSMLNLPSVLTTCSYDQLAIIGTSNRVHVHVHVAGVSIHV